MNKEDTEAKIAPVFESWLSGTTDVIDIEGVKISLK